MKTTSDRNLHRGFARIVCACVGAWPAVSLAQTGTGDQGAVPGVKVAEFEETRPIAFDIGAHSSLATAQPIKHDKIQIVDSLGADRDLDFSDIPPEMPARIDVCMTCGGDLVFQWRPSDRLEWRERIRRHRYRAGDRQAHRHPARRAGVGGGQGRRGGDDLFCVTDQGDWSWMTR